MPIASAMITIHRDHHVLVSNAPWPEIKIFVSQGQFISVDLPLLTTVIILIYLSIEIARVSRDGSAKKYRNKGTRNHDLIDEEPP